MDEAEYRRRMGRLEQLHAVMLLMLDDFSSICEQEGLSWLLSFGSAIGALREEGFIAWDDDIDICMPRADLDRLIAVIERDWAEKYQVLNAQTNSAYPMATTRVMLRGTEFRDESLLGLQTDSGVFLDLFPLDDVADDERAYRRQAWRAWLYNKLAIARELPSPHVAGSGLVPTVLRLGSRAAHALLNLPGVRSIDLSARSLRWQTRYDGRGTRRLGFLCETDRFSCTWRRDELFPARTASFEGRTVPVAHDIEGLLKRMYGDYMTPPPVKDQFDHFPVVLDLGPYA